MDNQENTQGVAEQAEAPARGSIINKLTNLSKRTKIIVLSCAVVLILLSVFVLVAAKAGNNTQNGSGKDVTTLINDAKLAEKNGDFQKARDSLTQALKLDKNNPEILSELITVNSVDGNRTGNEKKQLQASQPYIDQLLKTNPTDANTLDTIGYAYETAGNYQKTLSYFEQATKSDPKSAGAWFHLGHVYQFLGDTEQASQAYSKAYILDPNNPQVLMARGNALMSQGDAQGSYEAFLKASGLPGLDNETKSEALTGAASARATQNNYQYISDTLKLSKEAVDADPNFSPALAAYGYTLYLTTPVAGDKSQAVDYLKKAIAANPRISKNYLTLSKFYRVKGDFPNAINYNKQAIEKADEDNTLLSSQARALNKGMYEYELTRTYYQANQYSLVMPTLIGAIKLNSSIKQTLKDDFSNNGQFTDFAAKPEFVSLITE